MFDLNGDGKYDWQDDALFHTVIDKPDSNQETNTSHTHSGSLGWIVSAVVVL